MQIVEGKREEESVFEISESYAYYVFIEILQYRSLLYVNSLVDIYLTVILLSQSTIILCLLLENWSKDPDQFHVMDICIFTSFSLLIPRTKLD